MLASTSKSYFGLSGSHAYTVLSAQTVYNADGTEKAKLVLMRNPWGFDDYTGPWSDSDPIWND